MNLNLSVSRSSTYYQPFCITKVTLGLLPSAFVLIGETPHLHDLMDTKQLLWFDAYHSSSPGLSQCVILCVWDDGGEANQIQLYWPSMCTRILLDKIER